MPFLGFGTSLGVVCPATALGSGLSATPFGVESAWAALLHGCKAVGLQACSAAVLQGCRAASCRAAGLQGCRDAGLQGCRAAGLQGCSVARLQGYSAQSQITEQPYPKS